MPNVVELTVENPDELLDPGLYGPGGLFHLQWSATQTGTFADVAGNGSTPFITIIAGQRIYPGKDPAGIDTTWYQARFESLDGTRASSWKGPFQTRLDLADDGTADVCQIYDVKQRLGIKASDTTDDETLFDFIHVVSSWIHSKTGRRFARNPASGTTTFTFDVRRPTTSILIPQGIAEISLVEWAAVTGGAFTALASTDWFDDPAPSEREPGWPATQIALSDWGSLRWFYPGKRVVRATMAMGFAAVPGEIDDIAQTTVVRAFQARRTGQSDVVGADDFGRPLISRLVSARDRETLERYKVPNVA